jgi:hypothetical protein
MGREMVPQPCFVLTVLLIDNLISKRWLKWFCSFKSKRLRVKSSCLQIIVIQWFLFCVQGLGDKMAYTIIRPGGLQNEDGTGNGVLTEDSSVCGAIARADVADLVVKALFSPKTDNKVRGCRAGFSTARGWGFSRVCSRV